MQKELKFTKMHGAGNDYIYVNCLDTPLADPEQVSIKVSHRRFGIGADGLVLILPSVGSDYAMRIFNADGSEAEMCGNAVRCIGKYLYERGITDKDRISIETKGGIKKLELNVINGKVESVRVDMGEPILEGERVPVKIKRTPVLNEPFEIDGHKLLMNAISVGNPHAIFFVEKITDELVLGIGPKIENHELFPNRTNVSFVEVISPSEMRMRVWERGAGITEACGTGACASAWAAAHWGLAAPRDGEILVHMDGGDARVRLHQPSPGRVTLVGPAQYVATVTVDVGPSG